jgi:hypothetical protein
MGLCLHHLTETLNNILFYLQTLNDSNIKINDSLTEIIEKQQEHISSLNIQINALIDIVKREASARNNANAADGTVAHIDEKRMKSLLNLDPNDPILSAMEDVSKAKVKAVWDE